MAKRTTKPAFRVGLLGESPNDTRAIARLLGPRYGDRVEFFTLVERITGDMLEQAGTFKLLRREYQAGQPRLVIVIRDLDGLENDHPQHRKRRAFLRKVNKQVENRALPLLNVYSIEALIAAHLAPFNQRYGCKCVIAGDIMHLVAPVELLREASRQQYKEGHCGDLLAQADYDQLLANCRYFRDFDAAFAARVPPPIVLPSKAESDARNGG